MAHILLVHEHPTVRYTVTEYLHRFGHTVTDAARAHSALERADADVDVVVVDIGLPGMGAVQLVHALASRGHAPPVILISPRFPHAEEAAAVDYVLYTPFDAERLEAAIADVLGDTSWDQPALAM